MNTSVKICSLLEVEPWVYVRSLVSGCILDNPIPQDGFFEENMVRGRLEVISEIYPNMLKPSNFVNIFELTYNQMMAETQMYCIGRSAVEQYLEWLIEFMENGIKKNEYYTVINNFKTDAQKIEWRY